MKTAPSLTIPPNSTDSEGISAALLDFIRQHIESQGGWIGFDDLMSKALYTPGLGYYAHGSAKFGAFAQGLRDASGVVQGAGSDFVTAPELSALFGRTLAVQIGQAMDATGTDEVWEFGAGTGALAAQLLCALGDRVRHYTIVDLSDSLKERQRRTLSDWGDRVQWATALPEKFNGVVVGNEVLDAMPVKLLFRSAGVWHERGVVWQDGRLAWSDRITDLRPPLEPEGSQDYLTELHLQGEAFVRTLGEHLQAGAVFLIDYGFPESEYYHAQRHMGTVMCHRAHRSDDDPLSDVGLKDITAHVNFTGVAVAAQDAGLEVLGYTSQAHFLLNCGLAEAMQASELPERVAAQKLVLEHEMGELFKVIGLTRGPLWEALGFKRADRTHRL